MDAAESGYALGIPRSLRREVRVTSAPSPGLFYAVTYLINTCLSFNWMTRSGAF